MEGLQFLPAAIGVTTNVACLTPLARTEISSADLAQCFISARQSNSHTQPLTTNAKEIKRLLDRLDSFHASYLNTFLYAYMHPGAPIPNHVLDAVRQLCVNSDPNWSNRCQNLAVQLLTTELQARRASVIPRSNPDDPIALAQLRPCLPTLKHIPDASVGACHFRFVGNFDEDVQINTRVFSATVRVRNNGRHAFTLDLPQTQTIIDGVKVENRFIETTLEKQTLQAGESMEMTLTLCEAPRAGFSDFQQLIVLSVDAVVKFFVTFTVISPRQGIFRQRFPGCLPLRVEHSPLGVYAAPLMLQLLKHALIRQGGLSTPAVVNLLVCNAVNYRPQNVEVMQEAMRVIEIVKEQMNLSRVLATYWDSQPDAKKAPAGRRYQPPPSSAQPAGFLPGLDLATVAVDAAAAVHYFPNSATRLPDALGKAPPAVIMGVVLLWLTSLEAALFDASFLNCDPIAYLETAPQHLRGILLWVTDLCCALLVNRRVNGASERDLAITFASILDRPITDAEDDTEGSFADASHGGGGAMTGAGSSFAMQVARRQNIVTALLMWIALYKTRYDALY